MKTTSMRIAPSIPWLPSIISTNTALHGSTLSCPVEMESNIIPSQYLTVTRGNDARRPHETIATLIERPALVIVTRP